MIDRRAIVAVPVAMTLLGGCATQLREESEGMGPSEEEVLGLEDTATTRSDEPELIALDEFGRRSFEDGWRAERLIGLEVRGTEGAVIGEVDDIVIGADGEVESLILEVGGFLDIGDTKLKVGWDEVTLDTSGELRYAVVPIEEGEYERFSLFDGSDVTTGPRAFRVSELVGDYVTLDGTSGYAYVDDLVFDEAGALQAVVVTRNSSFGGGYYAYPYYGYEYGFDPGLGTYDLPYTADEVGRLDPFDYGTLGGFGAF